LFDRGIGIYRETVCADISEYGNPVADCTHHSIAQIGNRRFIRIALFTQLEEELPKLLATLSSNAWLGLGIK